MTNDRLAAARARAEQLYGQSTATLMEVLEATNEALARLNVPAYCTNQQAADGVTTGRWEGRPDHFNLIGIIVVSEARLAGAGARYS